MCWLVNKCSSQIQVFFSLQQHSTLITSSDHLANTIFRTKVKNKSPEFVKLQNNYFPKKNYLARLRTWKGWPTSKDLQIYCVVIHFQSHPLFSNELKQNEFTGSDSNFTPFLQMLEQKPIETRESLRKKMKRKMHKQICRPQVEFFPIIKVSPQFLIKGFSSNTTLIQIIC